MPDIRLTEIDLPIIRSEASVRRMLAATIPAFIAETSSNPDPATLFMQMHYVLLALGQHEFALDMQARALELQRVYRIAGPAEPKIRLLALMAAGDNIPLEFLVEGGDVRLDLLYLSPAGELPATIPDHDVAIVALRESDANASLLSRMESLLASWPRPVINPAGRVMRCARDTACRLLHDVPGLLVPLTARLTRGGIVAQRFPLIIRPIDSHAGVGLAKLENADELERYLGAQADAEFYVAEFVDYRDADGLFRKARIALIDRKPYLCHLAISDQWMVHYVAAGMHLDGQKRAEDAAMMASFDEDFAVRHRAALAAIAERLALDYVVIDCAVARDGRLLWFEADTGGWIHATDPADIFPYKQKVMDRAFAAFRSLLASRMAPECPAFTLP